MKQHYLHFTLIVLTLSCSFKEEYLTSNSWILHEGQYLGQGIEFKATDAFQLVDGNGNILKFLHFSEEGDVVLPGINSPMIHAKWFINKNKIKFEIDSAYYNSWHDGVKKLTQKEITELTGSEQNAIDSVELERKEKFKQSNPILTNTFEEAMKIYKNPFSINMDYVSNRLILESETTRLIAILDRSGHELLNQN